MAMQTFAPRQKTLHVTALECVLLLAAACGGDKSASADSAGTAGAASPTMSTSPVAGSHDHSTAGTAVSGPGQASTHDPQAAAGSGTASAGQPVNAGVSSAGSTAKSGSAGASGQATAGAGANAPKKVTLYWLDILGNTVWRANADGSEAMALVKNTGGISAPDGIVVDLDGAHIYWTNMGSALGGANNGTVQRAQLDGKVVETIVPAGVGNTFKQMTMDRTHKKLYWCDREGAKVWRSDLDGKNHEVLASGHGFNQLVGIALDVPNEQFYFTDRNAKKILRAGFQMPAGQTDANRSDIEELFVFTGNAMPIDLDLDLDKRMIYWTDRGLGEVLRASMDLPAGQSASTRSDKVTLISGVGEPIGIALDPRNGALYFGNVAGDLERANLDGTNPKVIAHSSSVTGVTLVYAP